MMTFLIYRKIYRGSFNVLIKILVKIYPIDTAPRNGNQIVLHNIMEAKAVCGRNIFEGRNEDTNYDILNDIVTLSATRF
jgi:hypothetical protein